jgi:hypothetical protein
MFHILPRSVSAIQIHPSEECDAEHLGLITHLPQGAEIELGGPGFNDQTIQVRCGSASYYVFLDDLELGRKHAAAASA